jgi:hypothetical protein
MSDDRPPGGAAEEASAEPEGAEEAPRQPRRLGRPALFALLLLVLLAAGVLLGQSLGGEAIQLANPDGAAVNAVEGTFTALPPGAAVLVAMDADLGTYPEIRATTRAALADLLDRGASIAFVSVSVEGRAIAVAELDRLRRAGAAPDRLLDLGFVAGAEAGMVRLVDGALRPGMGGPIAARMAQAGGGIGAFDLIVLVGGGDIGPRSWVEQVGTRLPGTPMVAIAPAFARPELAPYLRTGQLDGLLATVRDGAAYVERSGGEAATGDALPSAPAMLIGMVIALAVLLRQLAGALPRLGRSQPFQPEGEE